MMQRIARRASSKPSTPLTLDTPELRFDDDGRVLATEGLAVSAPWEVVPSANHPGHFFFFHTKTGESAWSVDLSVVEEREDLSSCATTQKDDDAVSFQNLPPPGVLGTSLDSTEFQRSRVPLYSKSSSASTATLSSFGSSCEILASSFDNFLPEAAEAEAEADAAAETSSSLPSQPSSINTTVTGVPEQQQQQPLAVHAVRNMPWVEDPFPRPTSNGIPSVEVLAGLGTGGYSTVVLVKPQGREATDDTELFAMKVLSKVKQQRSKDKKRMANELAVLRGFRHDGGDDGGGGGSGARHSHHHQTSRFLERCHAAFESATDVFFVCDYMAGGDLFQHMVRRMKNGQGAFKEAEARVLLAEITLGLTHLHEQGFIHRDLKVENVMLTSEGHVKLIDFGLAVEIKKVPAAATTTTTAATAATVTAGAGVAGQDQSQPAVLGPCLEQPMTPTGSLSYMAPELIGQKKSSSSGDRRLSLSNTKKSPSSMGGRHTDWWAMGILAFELMAGRTPWSSFDNKHVIKHEISNCRVVAPRSLSKPARNFLERLLEPDFKKRLGTGFDAEVKSASFFKQGKIGGVNWAATERGVSSPAFAVEKCQLGPCVVCPVESSKALQAYLDKEATPGGDEATGQSGKVVVKFGVQAPWFLGVDVVTRHPRQAQ